MAPAAECLCYRGGRGLAGGLRVAPWGVILLVLLGALGLTSLLTGIVLSAVASHRIHAAHVLIQRATVVIDSLEAVPAFTVPRDTLRHHR